MSVAEIKKPEAPAKPKAEQDVLTRYKVSKKPVTEMTTDQMLEAAARLDLAKRAIEAELEIIGTRLEEIEPLLIERMLTNETKRTTILGVTVHLRNELWASAIDVLGLKRWLGRNKAHVKNASAIVKETANTQTLSAMVREMVRKRKEELGIKAVGKPPAVLLPKTLVPLLKITEKTKLGFRLN
jgi:hypothetical protein